MGDRLTYVYCLVDQGRSASRPSLTRLPEGPPGASRPRLLEVDDGLRLVVADVPAERYGEAAIERGLRDLDWVSRCAVAHERVVESFLRARAVVPMKLFTLFLDDERAVADVRRRRRKLARVLERVAGCAEWGLRVTFDDARPAPRRAAAGTSGTDFLRAKQAARDAQKLQAARSRRDADAVHRQLARRASAARREKPGAVDGAVAARLLLDAAYLVPAGQGTHFRAAASRASRALVERGCHVSLSGPWPPYHFVEER
jgi:hypothetical protein